VHARSTTFRDRPEALDAGIALVRHELMPALLELPGCVGMSMLTDRGSGTCIVTTAWEDLRALRASAAAVAPLRRLAQQHFGAAPAVHTWEIGLLHRAHATGPGARARVTWMRMPRGLVDSQLEAFRTVLLPRAEALPGFCSASLLVDRHTGRSALAVVYDGAEALVASRTPAATMRADVLRRLSSELLDVAELEVALAHLRVPETV
jgi:hypothetical protein